MAESTAREDLKNAAPSAEQPPADLAASQAPAWLRVKSEIKAGNFDPPKSGLGPGESQRPRGDVAASQPPAWLKVKSEIKAGGIDPPKSGGGPGESGPVSATLASLAACPKTHTI